MKLEMGSYSADDNRWIRRA